MKCQVCQTRTATVHHTDLTEGAKSYHLCEECYAMQKPAGGEVLGMLASALSSPSRPADDPGAQVCTQCGLTYAAFRNRGRLGCPVCYDSFRPLLEPLLEKIHGGRTHVGKTPAEAADPGRPAAPGRGRMRVLISLRRKLDEAIRAENYELAASLRDEIRKAEQGEETA
jgi:protein arginine kinase activator